MTSLATSSDRIHVTEQKLRTLHFKPYDVRSFKTDLLLVLDGDSATVFIFTERGSNWQPSECFKTLVVMEKFLTDPAAPEEACGLL